MTKPKESLTVPARPEQSEGHRPLRRLRGLPPRKPGSVVRRYHCVAERRHRRPSHRRVGVPSTSRRSQSTGRLPRTLRLLAEVPRSRGTKPTLRANPYLHAAWALCLATVVLLRAAARSSEVALSIGFGGLLKERLFAGAMAFDADALRRKGIGELLSQVFEAETLEGLAMDSMDGGLQIVLAALELLIIPFVLSWGVSTRLEI